jgi:hypothetical protein
MESVIFKACVVIEQDVTIEANGKCLRKRFAHSPIPKQVAVPLQEPDLRKAPRNYRPCSIATSIVNQIDSYVEILNVLLAEERIQCF